jgi:hypothetical protein
MQRTAREGVNKFPGYKVELKKCLTKRRDTVGQPPSTEIGVLNMPSLKAKKLRKLPREKYS